MWQIEVGQYVACKFHGENGDLVLGRVKEIRSKLVVLENMLPKRGNKPSISVKALSVLHKRNKPVTEQQALVLLAVGVRSGRAAARKAAVALNKGETDVKKSLIVVFELPISSLLDAPCQPDWREDLGALTSLTSEMKKTDYCKPISVVRVGDRYYKADGHRRCEAWRNLGHTTIPCELMEGSSLSDVDRWWCSLNRATKRIDGRQWMHVWYKTRGKQQPPSGVKRSIERCEDIFGGREGLEYLLENKQQPCISSTIDRLQVQFRRTRKLRDIDVKTIGIWMVEHKMATQIQTTLQSHRDRIPLKELDRIATAVRKSRAYSIVPLKLVEPDQKTGT